MEILQRVPEGQTPRFSIAAHSLGGLISRCAIGKLEMLGAFTRVIPTVRLSRLTRNFVVIRSSDLAVHSQTFMTMCTPHLSSRRVGGVFGHYGKAIWQKMVHYVVQQQGETGKELLLADCENGAPPLLVRMTDLGTWPQYPLSVVCSCEPDRTLLFVFALCSLSDVAKSRST